MRRSPAGMACLAGWRCRGSDDCRVEFSRPRILWSGVIVSAGGGFDQTGRQGLLPVKRPGREMFDDVGIDRADVVLLRTEDRTGFLDYGSDAASVISVSQ